MFCRDDSGILNFIEFESAERAIDKAIELFKKADAHRVRNFQNQQMH